MQENQSANIWKRVSIALIILYFVLCFGIFYLLRHPEPLFGEDGHKVDKKTDKPEKTDSDKGNDKKFMF